MVCFVIFLLVASLASAAPLPDLLRSELDRSMARLADQPEPPYHVALQVEERTAPPVDKSRQQFGLCLDSTVSTVQTSSGMADRIYCMPVTVEFVEQVVQKEFSG